MQATVAPGQTTPNPTPTPTPTPTPEPDSDTFGLNTGNNSFNQFADALQAMRFQNTTGNGTLTQLDLLVDETSPSGNVRLGVYADNNGQPGSLILDAGETAVTRGWVSISNLNLPVTSGSYYWLAFNLQNDNSISYQSGQPTNSHYRINGQAYGSLPANFSSSTLTNTNQYVMQATVIGE
jgi:hypothetical protein